MEAKQGMNKRNVVVAIDPGSFESGVVILTDGAITHAGTSSNEEIIPMIRGYLGVKFKLRVVIEDIRPYYSMKVSTDLFDTCKYIGELTYRLNAARIAFELISRSEIKGWAYSAYKSQIEPLILKKMVKAGKHLNNDGSERESSMVWIDDQIIIAAMRFEWSIPAERGRSNAFGLSSHSWQALAIGTLYMKGYFSVIRESRIVREKAKLKKKELKKKKRLESKAA